MRFNLPLSTSRAFGASIQPGVIEALVEADRTVRDLLRFAPPEEVRFEIPVGGGEGEYLAKARALSQYFAGQDGPIRRGFLRARHYSAGAGNAHRYWGDTDFKPVAIALETWFNRIKR